MFDAQLVLGVDAGGTSTRVAVHRLDGTRIGFGKAGGGNPSAHGRQTAGAAFIAALRDALHGLDPSAVAGSVAGVAGGDAAFWPVLDAIWAEHGLPAGPRQIGDVPVAYAAGTPTPSGTLLLAGTGATAARIVNHEQGIVADGLGWLLGDEGSGFWIGRAGVRAVVRTLDASEPEGELTRLVEHHFLGERGAGLAARERVNQIVRLAQADRASLAPVSKLVSEAASAGDPQAQEIAREAAERLVGTMRRVHAGGPIVLAGSVLTSDGPVRRAVQDLLGDQPTVVTAGDGAGAAAWLAALPLLPPDVATASHPTFVTNPI